MPGAADVLQHRRVRLALSLETLPVVGISGGTAGRRPDRGHRLVDASGDVPGDVPGDGPRVGSSGRAGLSGRRGGGHGGSGTVAGWDEHHPCERKAAPTVPPQAGGGAGKSGPGRASVPGGGGDLGGPFFFFPPPAARPAPPPPGVFFHDLMDRRWGTGDRDRRWDRRKGGLMMADRAPRAGAGGAPRRKRRPGKGRRMSCRPAGARTPVRRPGADRAVTAGRLNRC